MVTITRIYSTGKKERFYVGEKGETSHIAWFDTLEEAALVCRFLSGATMSNYYQTRAMKVMQKKKEGGGGETDGKDGI